MARTRSKKVHKLRKYRDKLLVRITDLEAKIRANEWSFHEITKAMVKQNFVRVAALASDYETADDKFMQTNEIANELALVYKFLIVERQYAEDIQKSAVNRDYLRVAALCSTYKDEIAAHEMILSEWTQDHGFKRSLLRSMNDEDIA